MPRVDKSKSSQDPSNEIRLIELIRENPELYDAAHPLAKDNNQKRIIWEYISEEMNTPVDTLKKLWKKLRSNYIKKCRDIESEKTAKSTPCDEALAFLMTSVMEYANENSCGNSSSSSPRVGEDRALRSSSQLTAISEEERSTATLVPEEPMDSSAASPQDPEGKASDRVLRPRHSEPSRLPNARENPRQPDTAPRRPTTTPTTPSTRSRSGRNRKSTLNPNDSTRVFFDSMAITVASFPQYLQAVVKIQICRIVYETECEISSPKTL